MDGEQPSLVNRSSAYIHMSCVVCDYGELGPTEVQEEAAAGAAKFGAVFGTFVRDKLVSHRSDRSINLSMHAPPTSSLHLRSL